MKLAQIRQFTYSCQRNRFRKMFVDILSSALHRRVFLAHANPKRKPLGAFREKTSEKFQKPLLLLQLRIAALRIQIHCHKASAKQFLSNKELPNFRDSQFTA